MFSCQQAGQEYCKEGIYVKMTEYFGILLWFIISTVIAVAMPAAAVFLAPRRVDVEQKTSYECGFDTFGEARSPFDVSFYLVAILFLIFDIEVAYLFPFAATVPESGMVGFFSMVFFLGILTIGFIYEWAKGALDWD